MRRRLRYRVVLKGTTLSRHYTKAAAAKAASSVIGARPVRIRSYRRRKTYTRRY